jgi:hypothetical protein
VKNWLGICLLLFGRRTFTGLRRPAQLWLRHKRFNFRAQNEFSACNVNRSQSSTLDQICNGLLGHASNPRGLYLGNIILKLSPFCACLSQVLMLLSFQVELKKRRAVGESLRVPPHKAAQAPPTPFVKGKEMAVSKHIRIPAPETDPFFLELFRKSQISKERERAWRAAVRKAGKGNPALRFPVYGYLYGLNICAQEIIDLLERLSSSFALGRDSLRYHQSQVQYVRASVSQAILDSMAGVEITDAWLFENQRRREENSLRDPDDVYVSARERETERIAQGLPPRIKFLEHSRAPTEASLTKRGTTRRRRSPKFRASHNEV